MLERTPKPTDNLKNVKPADKLIGQNIRARRLALGLSQEELGDRIGLTYQQVQKYELGTNGARGSRLVAIAKALNTAVIVLFEGTEIGCRPIHSELPSLIINKHAIRLLRAFAKIKNNSSQRALVTLAEQLAGQR